MNLLMLGAIAGALYFEKPIKAYLQAKVQEINARAGQATPKA